MNPRKDSLRGSTKGWVGLAVVGLIAVAAATANRTGTPSSVDPPPAVLPAASIPALADTHPLGQWIEWRDADGPETYVLAGYQLQVSAIRDPDGSAAALVRVRAPDGSTTDFRTLPSAWANLSIAAERLQIADPSAQLLFASFSGGAHCCTDLVVLERREDHWRRTDMGQRDGEAPPLPQDRDGDGRKEFEFADQSFLYAFDAYASSWAPPVFKQIVEGRLVDISTAAGMRTQYANAARNAEQACRTGGNGACAAYVAASARAGGLDSAWAVMLESYDQASSWSLPTACRVRTAGACPDGASLTFATFPEALQWFLGERGYGPRVYIEPLQAAGPSFDCGAAKSGGEQAVCRSPHLALQDRMLAVAYTRALALTGHRRDLRETQRRFIAARNAEMETTALAALYQDRIDLLLSVE